ncbi:hypothetical protein MKX41_30755 [Paenibacillus sp. FSL R5-0475]|uniref:hypothetical protein n=1 Tax=Paenibacillus sp. FSL R5-0475 TaxID=2921643 RepID=UPI0030F6F31E
MTQRDWQKDMESCLKLKEWHENDWMTGTEEGTGIWIIHEVMPDEPCQYVAECENELVVDFIMTAHEALPYWLQEAKTLQEIASGRGREVLRLRSLLGGLNDELTATEARADAAEQRERQLKEAIEEALKWTWYHGEANMTEIDAVLNDILATLYPDTPEPTPEITTKPIDEWHEDLGDVLWWIFPVNEPPYCGSPMDMDWPDYHTHWTPLVYPVSPVPKEGE